MSLGPAARRQQHLVVQRAVQALIRTIVETEGPEHTMEIRINVREGTLQTWRIEKTRKPIEDLIA